MHLLPHRLRAFTLTELLVSLGIVILVVWVLITPAGSPTRPKAQRIKCINNLKNLALAMRIYYTDNNPGASTIGSFTNLAVLRAADYFRALSNELSTPNILICPADARVVSSTNFATLTNRNISYFANVLASTNNTDPSTFLFGDRNLQTNGVPLASGASLKVVPNLNLGWTGEIHNDSGIIAIGDGSVQQFSSARLRAMLQNAEVAPNLLLIP